MKIWKCQFPLLRGWHGYLLLITGQVLRANVQGTQNACCDDVISQGGDSTHTTIDESTALVPIKAFLFGIQYKHSNMGHVWVQHFGFIKCWTRWSQKTLMCEDNANLLHVFSLFIHILLILTSVICIFLHVLWKEPVWHLKINNPNRSNFGVFVYFLF